MGTLPPNLSRMTSIWELANPGLRDLAVYEPGKPIEETARELGVDPSAIVKLASNPNNPTGTLVSQCAIHHFMSQAPDTVIVVFDEAYFEFLDDSPDTLRFVRERRNVVVLRTFSKIHGLAGLRIGYAVAPSEIIEVLHKTRQPFNINSIAHAGALAAL